MKRRTLLHLTAAWMTAAALTSSVRPLSAAPLTAPVDRAGDHAVDLALVLAIDSSASITDGDMAFQLRGHAAAFRNPRIRNAVASGVHGAIAVIAVQWSGPNTTGVLIPWTRLASPADAEHFAATLEHVSGSARIDSTAIGSAIQQATALFDRIPWPADRQIIDLCSNGFSNSGIDPTGPRDAAVARGIGINAVVILDEYDWLEQYYQENVIGGPGAFVRVAESRDSFADAILEKLATEIAGIAASIRLGGIAADPVGETTGDA
ncbi:MAG: DUF1194 domain-containing protein [Azospirillaceae bacterium]|nr:DUF1194 domain-containing protein [Azospirillaceae bacterium]